MPSRKEKVSLMKVNVKSKKGTGIIEVDKKSVLREIMKINKFNYVEN